MDSTTVQIIADAATKLGMTGATAFGWYLVANMGLSIFWGLILLLIAFRVIRLISNYTALNATIKELTSNSDVYSSDISRARAILRQYWHK